jgi:gliding motility-associated lipoprotein GldJ
MKKLFVIALGIALLINFTSCKNNKSGASTVTGWNYNDPKNGGFEKVAYGGQEVGPGLVFIEGGAYMMGQKDQDVMSDWNNVPRKVSVNSFYMDETEVANIHYREYLFWLNRVFGESFPQVVARALPDTLVWRDEMAYNEPYTEYYLRHPSYNMYPVVGVNWLQANDFAKWRSDRVNENTLIKKGIIAQNSDQVDENNFNTEAYLAGQYDAEVGKKPLKTPLKEERNVKFEDGILQPDYRLPTEAEWEYAAYALIGNQPYKGEERFADQKIYPWNGFSLRYPKSGKSQGKFLANFKRGRGDMMGIAGALNDDGFITTEVTSNYPNDFGLYNMAGNVNEWVMDVYRPMTSIDGSEYSTFRGNVFRKKLKSEDGLELAEKDSLGRVQWGNVTDEEAATRRNYRKADVRNYVDQDPASLVEYQYGSASLINDNSRVYKGGSWKDIAYWLSPGSRRFYQESESFDDLGFRCAMDRMGSPKGNKFNAGNIFKGNK